MVAQPTQGISLDPAQRTPEEQARWLLAYILDWHRREEKTAWWEWPGRRVGVVDLCGANHLCVKRANDKLEFN